MGRNLRQKITAPLLIAGLTTGVTIAIPERLEAREACGFRTEIIKKLKDNYYEELRIRTLGKDSSYILEFFSKNRSSDWLDNSWTLLVTYPTGLSCMLGSGDGLEIVDREGFGIKFKLQ
tara:strand:- start:307 stop:663 length:357 start_codon:yes stop_codon:yes gene_type:complete